MSIAFPQALAEIARVLRPGGALLATVPTFRWESEGPFPSWRRAGLHGLSHALNGLLRRAWHHVTLDEREGWQDDRLERAGFRLLVWERARATGAYLAEAVTWACALLLAIRN